jgi:hypothetical protein
MLAKSYTLQFSGYSRARNRAGLPSTSGAFCVYRSRKVRFSAAAIEDEQRKLPYGSTR